MANKLHYTSRRHRGTKPSSRY
ncbi:unnamed protein product, partial [Rotaria magnacalcarata]